MKKIQLSYKANVEQLGSYKFHPLSKNGPFIDAHFGPLTDDDPVGQTYYIRPLTKYTPPCINNETHGCGCLGIGEGKIKFTLQKCFPAVHFNTNTTTTNLAISGDITISPFEWDVNGVAKIFNNQVIDVNLTIFNNTNEKLAGFHIHDGINKGTMAGFGQISYFLMTSPEWQNRYNINKPNTLLA